MQTAAALDKSAATSPESPGGLPLLLLAFPFPLALAFPFLLLRLGGWPSAALGGLPLPERAYDAAGAALEACAAGAALAACDECCLDRANVFLNVRRCFCRTLKKVGNMARPGLPNHWPPNSTHPRA